MLKKISAEGLIIKQIHWSFLPFWIVANAIGYAGGGMIGADVTNYVTGNLSVILSLAVMSMAIALAQWLVIRNQILGMGWLWTTWLGGTLGGSLSSWASFQLAITYGDAVDLLTMYACLRGFSTGLMQWTVLKQNLKFAEYWMLTTTGSWYISILVGSLLIDKQLGYFLTVVVGAIYGLLTGIVLLVLLRKRDGNLKRDIVR